MDRNHVQPDPLLPIDPALEAELDALDREMPRIQATSPDIFALATQWAERHDAILERTPPHLREAMQAQLHRIGIRWGMVNGTRMTAQFPALRRPDDEAA
jgi:hypothetical protein